MRLSGKGCIDSKGDLCKMKHQLAKLLPLGWNPAKLMDIQVESKEWIPFENSKLELIEPSKAPKMKNQVENHRLKLVPQTKEVSSKPVKKLPSRESKKRSLASTSGIDAATLPRIPKKKTKPAETILLSDSEPKDKRMKQAKITNLKKVIKI